MSLRLASRLVITATLLLSISSAYALNPLELCRFSFQRFHLLTLRRMNIENYNQLRATAVEYATNMHGQQKYADQPYNYHLEAVEKVLKDFGFDPQTSIEARYLSIAAFLHDVLEDTAASKADLEKIFGKEIAQIVDGVTQVKKEEINDPYLRKIASIKKIKNSHYLSITLKLADRIANVNQGRKQGDILQKYYDQHKDFRRILFRPSRAEELEMWKYLDSIFGSNSN